MRKTKTKPQMIRLLKLYLVSVGLTTSTILLTSISYCQETPSLRTSATFDLSFDQPGAPFVSSSSQSPATAVQPRNAPRLIRDPFRLAPRGHAVRFERNQKQFIEISDHPNVGFSGPLSISMLVINLSEPKASQIQGLFAKRAADPPLTNYGVNFVMSSDVAQFYVHDGQGFRIASYRAQEVVPPHKRIHLVCVLSPGDAPDPDADTDADDLRFEVFVNGAPITPQSVMMGAIDGTAAWTYDVQPAHILTQAPLMLGRSGQADEYFSGIIDDFLIIPRALSQEEVAALFQELVQTSPETWEKTDSLQPLPSPQLSRIEPPAWQINTIQRVVFHGRFLQPDPQLLTLVPDVEVRWDVASSRADHLVAEIFIPSGTLPQIIPIWLCTSGGITTPLYVSLDSLPLRARTQLDHEDWHTPVAVWGFLQGNQRERFTFRGQAGQHFAADVELRRLGGQAEPVLELHGPRGQLLTIAWGQTALHGDSRLLCELPEEGTYTLYLHDLAFNAPGMNPYRLKMGPLQFIDQLLPYERGTPGQRLALGQRRPGKYVCWPISIVDSSYMFTTLMMPQAFPEVCGPAIPVTTLVGSPQFFESSVRDVWSESPIPILEPTQVLNLDQLLPADAHQIGINGWLEAADEVDRFLLQASAGQTLWFQLQSRSIGASFWGEIAIGTPGGDTTPLAVSSERPSHQDPLLHFSIPEGSPIIEVRIRDLLRHAHSPRAYRLMISRQPPLSLGLKAQTEIMLPQGGTALLESTISNNPSGATIHLIPLRQHSGIITHDPLSLAPGETGKRLLRIHDQSGRVPTLLHMIAQAPSVPNRIAPVVLRETVWHPEARSLLAMTAQSPVPFSLDCSNPPTVLYKGTVTRVPLKVTWHTPDSLTLKVLRPQLYTTEAERLRQQGNPAAGVFPRVQLLPDQWFSYPDDVVDVIVETPLETVEPAIDLALGAEVVSHAYAQHNLGISWAAPFRCKIVAAVNPKLSQSTWVLSRGQTHDITGNLQRSAGFNGEVEVSLLDLPTGLVAPAILIPADQDTFSIKVTATEDVHLGTNAKVKLLFRYEGRSLIATPPEITLQIP